MQSVRRFASGVPLYPYEKSRRPQSPLQQTLSANLLFLKAQRTSDGEEYLHAMEILLGEMARVNAYCGEQETRRTSRETCFSNGSHRLRYKLELLDSFLHASEVSIPPDYWSLLHLEIAKVLYRQGFTHLAVSTIR